MTAIQPNTHPGQGGWKHFLALLVAWGPQGLFLLAILDSAGLPVVGGVDLLLVNVATSSPEKAYLAAACALAGSLIGSSILFAIARKGGDLMLSRQLATPRGARMHRWFERYGLDYRVCSGHFAPAFADENSCFLRRGAQSTLVLFPRRRFCGSIGPVFCCSPSLRRATGLKRSSIFVVIF